MYLWLWLRLWPVLALARFTNETFVKSKIQVATPHSLAPHSQLQQLTNIHRRLTREPEELSILQRTLTITHRQKHTHTHTQTHLPGSLASLDSLSRIPSSIYSCTASPHGQARSGPGRRFIMFCNLCPFIVWFSTAFRLVVDQLNMAASSAQLWQSTNLHMTGQMDNWTIRRVDKRTLAKVNLRPAAGFQKCISNTRVLVSYAKSRRVVCVCVLFLPLVLA